MVGSYIYYAICTSFTVITYFDTAMERLDYCIIFGRGRTPPKAPEASSSPDCRDKFCR